MRHSLAHLLAAAVLELYPNAKPSIGPSIENGFYYDFDFSASRSADSRRLKRESTQISDKDLPRIEKKMKELLPSWELFERIEVTPDEARQMFSGNPYKVELIDELEKNGEQISLYYSGPRNSIPDANEATKLTKLQAGFLDLCRGGHVEHPSKDIDSDAFTLTHIAGAYWRGDEKNPMLTRIYGLAFNTKKELEEHLAMQEEAKKRDHRKLGKELGLFMFHETSPGMPYWLPKGVVLYNELVNFWREDHRARGYQEIVSPLLNKKELYITSGHYDHYWSEMFVAETGDEDEEYGVKAMNCPNAHVVFASQPRSYKDLPLRLSDTDTLHRHERSGTLSGLLRVRSFRQDDAHIYVAEDQIEAEYQRVFEIVERFYSLFGMSYSYRLSTRPEDIMGNPETWTTAENTLKKILDENNKPFTAGDKEGAFYGPKVDIMMKDVLGREWQMGTIQLDFQQPRRFNLEYTDKDGTKKMPIVIHRVIYGSLERFIGILIEHYAGAFPLWLSPIQIKVLPIGEGQYEYAQHVHQTLKEHGIRAELDDSNETLGKKIRNWKLEKVPYALVIGDKEVESQKLKVESRDSEKSESLALEKLLEKLQKEIANKA